MRTDTGNTDGPAAEQVTGIRCLIFVAAIVAGVALAWLISPAVFRAFPTDMTRTSVILDALADEAIAPRVVLFGTSVAMASADMRKIRTELDGNPTALNLASTGQTPFEGYLYYQELPDSVELIIQMVEPSSVINWDMLDPRKYNAFYMYGYRPDERTVGKMRDILGREMNTLFDESDFSQRFESRWVVRQMADRLMRGVLRDDLELDRATNDLLFPNSGAQRLPDRLFERALEQNFGKTASIFYAKPPKMDFLAEMRQRAIDQGKQIIFVLMPVHPAQHEYRGEQYFVDARQRFAEFSADNDVVVLDAMDVIPGELYVDAVHPGIDGAELFSSWLARELNRLRSEGEVAF